MHYFRSSLFRAASSMLFLAAMLAQRTSAETAGGKVYGSAFLEPAIEGRAAPERVVKLRYRCEVTRNDCHEAGMWKIIFVFHFFRGADSVLGRELQTNLYSWRFAYPHLSRRARSGEVAGLTLLPGQSSAFLSVPDNHKDRRVGARSRAPQMFPTLDQEIDGFPDLWKREQVSQADLTGKELRIEVARGGMAKDHRGWSVHESLPAGEYRIWTVTANWDGVAHAVDFALPNESAQYYAAGRMLQIATEAFTIHPGAMRAAFWDFECQREDDDNWVPLTEWKLVQTDARPGASTWGMRRTEHRGRPAIEVSNTGKDYLEKGQLLLLK